MNHDMTDSVYAMLVLAYATLAATNYIFGSLELRAKTAISKINDCRKGVCKFIWEGQQPAIEIPPDGKASTEEKIRRRYDNVSSAGNMMVERWMWLQVVLFVSVTLASVLLLPVLLIKMEMIADTSGLAWLTRWALICEQSLGSISVVLVGINILQNALKLWRMEELRDDLKKVAAGVPKAGNTIIAVEA
jgi:hypothetical protein